MSSERRWIIDLLLSDLYERVTLDPGSSEAEEWMLWRSPLGWEVGIKGPRDKPVVNINRPDGTVFLLPSPMTVEALQGILP